VAKITNGEFKNKYRCQKDSEFEIFDTIEELKKKEENIDELHKTKPMSFRLM
jgi:hypothetical protein